MSTILVKRGPQDGITNLVLQPGEFALAKDTGNLYIGTDTGKIHLNPPGGTSDVAVKLQTPREFSISGDGTAAAVTFDGTQNVGLTLQLAAMSGLSAGTYTKVTVDTKGRVTAGTILTIEDLPSIPYSKITGGPTKVSEFTNDSGYQTEAQVAAKVAALVSSAPETLDTLQELAEALGNDPDFAATVTEQIAGKEPKLSTAQGKGSITDADTLAMLDSAESNATKTITWAQVKTALETYFNTLYNNYVHPTYAGAASGLYKITVDTTGHVSGVEAVEKDDITALGIPAQDTVYTLPAATDSVRGGVKVGNGLNISGDVLSVGDIDGGTF